MPEIPQDTDVPQQDELEEMYPAQPEKDNKAGLIIGIVAAAIVLLATVFIVVLGVANNWWRVPSTDEDNTVSTTQSTAPTEPSDTEDPDSDKELTAEQLRDRLTEFTANGLKVYLPDNFEELDSNPRSMVFGSADLEVTVAWGPLSEFGQDIGSSREFAKHYEDSMKDEFDDIQRTRKHDIYYTVATKGQYVTLSGFYVKDGFGWMTQIETKDYESRSEELINYVTLGLIDENFSPSGNTDKKEFVFAGLGLTLDSSLTATDDGESCIYENDDIMISVQFTSLDTCPASTSKGYAEWYLNEFLESGWTRMYMETSDNSFYYVSMADDEGMASIIGMYTHEDVAWIVSASTENADQFAATILEYVTSGRIIPEEIPEIQQSLLVEFSGIELELFGAFKETHRKEDYVRLSDGTLNVTISHGSYANVENAPISVGMMAQQDFVSVKNLWDNVELSTLKGVNYLSTWDNAADAVNAIQGYYKDGDLWWIIRVEATGTDHLEDMLGIAVNGVLTETIPDEDPEKEPFQRGELIKRNRIVMNNQSTAEYHGLQVSFSPDWLVDDSFGPTGDYYSDKFTMFSHKAQLQDMDVTNSIDMAWRQAEDVYTMWDNYEVGIAGGVPYLLLWDDAATSFSVQGFYDDGVNYWQISIAVADPKLVDQAVWYATAGIVLSDSASA